MARLLLVSLFLGSTLGILSDSARAEPAWWTQQKKDCGLPSSLAYNDWVAQGSPCNTSSSSPSPAASTRDYEAERRQQEAAAAAAAAEAAAETERLRVAEAARIKADADKRQADFIRMRDETVSLLKDSGGNSGLKGVNEYGLKDSGGNSASLNNSGLKGVNEYGLKDAGDPKVVNTQHVPSGLPKAMDNAIAGAYANAPPGVSDRVRKGFQAVMTRDWKVAKAWFGDALNHDPNNADLKRLVALADYTQSQPPATPPPKAAATTTSAPDVMAELDAQFDRLMMEDTLKRFHKDYLPKHPELEKPNPDDFKFMFPGLQGMTETKALDMIFGISIAKP